MATQTVGRGLSPADLARIRETLAAGRRPKVVFTQSAGQIAGQVGQVVELTDPDGSDEFVVVRFGRDELPFSPADLAVPPRAPTRRAAAAVPEQQQAPGRDTPAAARSPEPVPDTPAKEQPMPSSPTSTASKPKTAAPKAAVEPKLSPEVKAAEVAPEPVPPVAEPAVVAAPAAPKARKAARPKPAPSLTITVTYADGEWMVTATQGAKTLAKPYVLRPAEALRMVALLDVPGVHEAVDDIVSAARDEAQRQADRLRAELAEVESRLAELRETP